MSTLVVGVSDCRVSAEPGDEVTTYALGSCIGLAVYDPLVRVGGLLHFMLPDSEIASQSERNPFKFADSGIPRLIAEVCALGFKAPPRGVGGGRGQYARKRRRIRNWEA